MNNISPKHGSVFCSCFAMRSISTVTRINERFAQRSGYRRVPVSFVFGNGGGPFELGA